MNAKIENIYKSFQQCAEQHPRREVVPMNGEPLDFRGLLHRVDRTAELFLSLGVGKGDSVAIAMRNGLDFIVCAFALYKIGAATVPINFMISKQAELEFILTDSRAKGVITQKEFLPAYRRLKFGGFLISADGTDSSAAKDLRLLLKDLKGHARTHHSPGPDDIASILYTSGTTGNPKGVLLTHRNILSNAWASAEAFHVTGRDVFVCLLPMFHTFAWTTMVVLPLTLGCKTLVVSHLTPAGPWLQLMGRHGATIMTGVPQLFSVLAKEARGLKRFYLRYWAFRNMRICMSGAAPLPETVIRNFESALGASLLEGYGLTETAPVVSANRPHARVMGSVGLPIPGVQVKIVDENGYTLHHGQEGEICVSGPNVTPGYFGKTDDTEALFTHDGWLKTGDIGALDARGFLHIKDRKKDMIIVKGLKVFPAQIEAVLHEHPAVAEAAVIGVPSHNGEDELIKCFCVAKAGHKVDKAALSVFLHGRLDPYKRPREIELVQELPKNSLNKVLKRNLRKQEIEKRQARKKQAAAA
ncbi:MAG: long-chain fatty acid--CoA ligase [Elusimicrobia bacterium]|nr:long-chain fatty acid--CoA ligase [Elusimicrobiota bacterium]